MVERIRSATKGPRDWMGRQAAMGGLGAAALLGGGAIAAGTLGNAAINSLSGHPNVGPPQYGPAPNPYASQQGYYGF